MELKYDQSKRGHISFTNQFASYMVISLIRMSLICTLKWKAHLQGLGNKTDKRDLDIKLFHQSKYLWRKKTHTWRMGCVTSPPTALSKQRRDQITKPLSRSETIKAMDKLYSCTRQARLNNDQHKIVERFEHDYAKNTHDLYGQSVPDHWIYLEQLWFRMTLLSTHSNLPFEQSASHTIPYHSDKSYQTFNLSLISKARCSKQKWGCIAKIRKIHEATKYRITLRQNVDVR